MDRIQLRRDTAARWADINPVLLEGEVGYETDTRLRKIGDGVNRWNDLEYLKADGIINDLTTGGADKALSAEMGKVLGDRTDYGFKPAVYGFGEYSDDILSFANSLIKEVHTKEGVTPPTSYDGNNLHLRQLLVTRNITESKIIQVQLFTIKGTERTVVESEITLKSNASNIDEKGYAISSGTYYDIVYDTNVLLSIEHPANTVILFDATLSNPYIVKPDLKYNFFDGSALEDNSVSEDKLSKEVREKINKKPFPSFLYGKKLYTLCDSLGAENQWQNRLAELTGAIFDGNSNYKHYSFGGTKTAIGVNSAQERAKLMFEEGADPDVVIIENVNDGDLYSNTSYRGTKEDESFFRSNIISVDSETFSDKASANSYFDQNIETLLPSSATIGSIVKLPIITSNSKILRINGDSPGTGDFAFYASGSAGYVHVDIEKGDTISEIVNKIHTYSVFNYELEIVEDGNAIKFTKIDGGSFTLTVRVNTTGIPYSIVENVEGTVYAERYFYGHDPNNWKDSTYWVENISLWSAYKGLVEYILSKFPTCVVFLLIPKTYSISNLDTTYLRADGTIDVDKVLSEKTYLKNFFDFQTEFADYYEIPIIDIRKESCLTPVNFREYMTNNVHPQQSAYDRWADTIARLIK